MTLTALERNAYEDQDLWCWHTADNLVDGSGSYADKGPRGIGLLQATVGKQPAVVNNWRGLTGVNAWSFDGAATVLPVNGRIPAGAVSFVFLLDIDSTCTSGSNTNYTVAGSRDGHASTLLTKLRMQNLAFKLFVRNAGSGATAAQAKSTPLVVTWAIDPVGRLSSVRVNGGAWVSFVPIYSSSHFNTSFQLGAGGDNDVAISEFFLGMISSAMIYKCAFTQSNKASQLYNAEHALAERGGIVLP